MHRELQALRLTIFVGETDSYHHRPLYKEIIQRARRAGLAGASVFHGIDGFGPSPTDSTRTARCTSSKNGPS
jgi:PII-like signaling protein